MKKIAFLFPGQGSQSVGMGRDLFESFESVQHLFSTACEITGLDLRGLCFSGPMSDLTLTVNLQPAVTAVNLSLLGLLEAEGISPALCAGHSLGEFSALRAAKILSDEDTLRMVFRRGELMHREAVKNKGAMSAIIGLDIQGVSQAVENAKEAGIVSVANHNAEKQIVITGSPEGVKKAGELAAEQGGKAIPLKVSGAWHSELIRGAEAEFKDFLDTFTFSPPAAKVLHNVTADTESDPNRIRELMARQLCSPVKWYDTMMKMMDEKIEIFVEVGPGRVLTGLMKKIRPKDYPCEIFNVSDGTSLEVFISAVKA